MRNLAIAILAIAGTAIAVPASAQDVYVGAGPPGVGIGVDVDHDRGYHRGWRHHYAYDEDDAVVVRRHGRHCTTTIVHRYGETRRIRRCW